MINRQRQGADSIERFTAEWTCKTWNSNDAVSVRLNALDDDKEFRIYIWKRGEGGVGDGAVCQPAHVKSMSELLPWDEDLFFGLTENL
jgi:hypothetical protein